jgi:regulator of replication initiation timing
MHVAGCCRTMEAYRQQDTISSLRAQIDSLKQEIERLKSRATALSIACGVAMTTAPVRVHAARTVPEGHVCYCFFASRFAIHDVCMESRKGWFRT